MYKEINSCRICGNKNISKVLSLGNLTLTGVFPKQKNENISSGPVDLVKCDEQFGCGLVQLMQSYSLNEMYGMNYGYRSGLNSSMVQHLKSKVDKILSFGILKPGDLIIDIGSNDSTTLRAYPKNTYELVGIDPTGVKFAEFYTNEIKLIPEFFSANAVSNLFGNRKAKVITSFSMFYDLEDPVRFSREIVNVLHEDGIWILEQSYLPSMLLTNSFDTICHEHLEFYSLRQIKWICDQVGLKIIDVEFNDINGGSFSIVASKISSNHQSNGEKISKILSDESRMKISEINTFIEFHQRIDKLGYELVDFIKRVRTEGKSVYALGASTKGNVLLQYFGIDHTLVEAIGEVNPDKYGSFTPKTLIPIISEKELLSKNPDYILILPWHFKNFFLQLPNLKGRKLIFPLPSLEIFQN